MFALIALLALTALADPVRVRSLPGLGEVWELAQDCAPEHLPHDSNCLAVPGAPPAWLLPGTLSPDHREDFRIGLRDFLSGRPEAALQSFSKLEPAESPQVDFLLGAVLAQLGRSEEAVERQARVLQSQPRHAGALSVLAGLFFRIESYPKAAELCSRALDADPAPADCYGILGTVRLLDGEFAAALQQYRRLADASRSPSRAGFGWLGAANALAGLERYAEALQALQAAQEAAGVGWEDTGWEALFGDAAGLRQGVLLAEARALAGLERWQEAASRFERALEQEPALATSDVLIRFGQARSRQGRWEEAAGLFERAAIADPESADAFHWLGVARSWLGDGPRAVEAFERARRLRPSHSETLYLLGVAYLRQGREAEARQIQQSLAGLDGELAGELLRRIEQR